MKTPFLLTLFCLLSSPMLFGQTSEAIPIDSTYKYSVELPMLLQRGKTYTIQSDSVFAINGRRWHYYAKLEALKRHNNIGDADTEFLDMIQHYQRIVDSCEYYFQLLQKNADNTHDKGKAFLENTQKTIESSMKNLSQAQTNLDTASTRLTRAETHLVTAIEEIKKAKKRHLWQKIGIGVGSFAIGVIVGIFAK